MKKNRKLFGVIAVLALIMVLMALASCDLTSPSVKISGTPRLGQTITATSEGNGFDSNHGFEWATNASASGSGWYGWTTGHGSGGSQYTVSGSIGNYIQARRYHQSTDEYLYSNTIGPILSAD